jgi:hypothetical protein
MPVPTVPPRSILRDIFDDEKKCFDYLVSKRILSLSKSCACGRVLDFQEKRRGFRCSSRSCRMSHSIFTGTFFSRSMLPVNQVMELAYHWLTKSSVSTTIVQTGRGSETVCAYFDHFRNLVADSLDEVDYCIGGPGIVVELDESKFGKRKYHRGHRVDGVWVLGGVERTKERRVFLVSVPDRSLQTLEDIISRHVYPESIIHTDCWRGYLQLARNFEYSHQTVNHSRNFVDPLTGAHTNTIEGTWAGVKRGIPVRNRVMKGIDDHLFEFIWRRVYSENLWDAFIQALNEVAYDE